VSINKSNRLKILLEKGFFPEELPPPFQTKNFAKYRKSIQLAWPTNLPPKSIYEGYSIKRIGLKRRKLAVVNPVSQYYLSKKIADDWIELRKFLSKSKVTLDRALISENGRRAIGKPDFRLVQSARINASANDDYLFKSDISRFYDTIYTHALAWALQGKTWSKQNIGPALNATLGGQLDILVRKGQDNQTQGIPIGPDTSRILSEIMGVAVETEFLAKSNLSPENVYRYVDDWFVGIGSQADGEDALQKLSHAGSYYGLDLNIEKTRVVLPSESVIALWPEELLALEVSSGSAKKQARQLALFFATAFELAQQNSTDNVLLFALKLARSFPILRTNYTYFESFVYKVVRADNVTLPTAVQLVANYKDKGFSPSVKRASLLAHDIIFSGAPLGFTQEVAWSLFLLKVTHQELSSVHAGLVGEMESSVCALILLDLLDMGLVETGYSTAALAARMTSASLWDENWLLAYEADIKGWLPSAEGTNHVDASPWFRVLKDRNVQFYDRKKNVERFSVSRQLNFEQFRMRRSTSQIFAFFANIHGRYGDDF
jgi:Reverse transcriptase (RNA-dependent DNA polymerase)